MSSTRSTTFRRSHIVAGLDDFNSTADARSIDLHARRRRRRRSADGGRVRGRSAGLDSTTKTGLKALEDIDDISIVAAPGSTYQRPDDPSYDSDVRGQPQPADHARRAHALPHRRARLRATARAIQDVRAQRAKIDSKYAALLLPVGPDPRSDHRQGDRPAAERLRRRHLRAQRHQPRGLQGAGQRGRQPARSASSRLLNKAQQDVLNPEGINCFRFFEGRGFRLWGARTISSDPEWKYVNLRRYFVYLEHSIDKGTQWAVFEPNGERAVGQRAPHDRGLPAQRVADGRAARRQARESVLRASAIARR